MSGSSRPVPIVDNYAAIAKRLNEITRKSRPFVMPDGVAILLSSDVNPPLRMPTGIDTVFLLHMSSVTSRLTIIHMRDPEVVGEKLAMVIEEISRHCPSARRERTEIMLSGEDTLRLVELLRGR